MSNFLKGIEEELATCNDETVEAVVVGKFQPWYREGNKYFPDSLTERPIDWEEVKEYFNYEYDDGFGGAECHPVYIYTKSYILYVSEYDGSTAVCKIPRNPIKCSPNYL